MKQQQIRYLLKWSTLLLISSLVGCATTSSFVTLDAVGPGRTPCNIGASPGYLRVYTATEEHNDGDVMYYPHTEYTICNPNGTRFRTVSNHIGMHDEDPATVTLPSGHYVIIADSETDGRIKVPVTVGEGRTTVVELEGKRARNPSDVDPADAVKTPSGQIAGWRAAS
ncbi:MAG: hypothetical protein WCH57_08420 [Verrucomicrobiota bacterium]